MEEPLRKLGPYTLIRKIGRGAFGVVWLAEKQTAIATTRFALKLPRDEDIDLEAFKQEAAIWVQASGHQNVVSLIEADVYDGHVVLVSEYVPDGSLATWLKQHGGQAPSIESACEMTEGILAGLAHLHERRIIHRDLKPDNILLQRDSPRLADFGIARLLRTGSYSTNISGTLAYMAPEAFDGKRNEQTDVWAVGVILYLLLAGRLPYPQQDTPSFIGAIMRLDPPPLPESLPPVLRSVVAKALQRDAIQRYASATEMRNAMRAVERVLWLQGHGAGEVPLGGSKDSEPTLVSRSFQETRMPNLPATEVLPIQSSKTATSTEEPKPQEMELDEATRLARPRPPTDDERAGQRQPEGEAVSGVPPTIDAGSAVNTRPDPGPAETIITPPPKPFPQEGPPRVEVTARRARKLAMAISLGIVLIAVGLTAAWWISSRIKVERARAQSERDLHEVRAAALLARNKGFKNKIGIEFALIPAGSFMMGSEDGRDDEKPVHRVTISRDFYMEETEVTQAQWQTVMGNNPSYYLWPTHPVESVDWLDTQRFIEKLNQMNDGYTYRLPTEAEWEYACRAGTTDDYAGDLNSMAWYKENSHETMQEVKQKQPNAFGLYDMHGGVEEWCQDWGDFDYYKQSPSIDPQGPTDSKWRVIRGGAFSYDAPDLRSSRRDGSDPYGHLDILGFRVVAVTRTK